MNADRTPLFYMANLGAEVSRLFAARNRGEKAVEPALDRCKQIINDFLHVEEHVSRKREILLLKDVLEDVATGENRYNVSEEDLEEYFLPFALRLQTQ